MESEFKIRKIKKSDLEELCNLIERCLKETCKDIYSKGQLEYWISLYSKNNFLTYTKGWSYWICIKNQKIIGCIALNNNEVKGMFVDPKNQGKGIGKIMLDFVEEYTKKKGSKKLILDSSLNAVRFYEKYGFSIIKEKFYQTSLFPGSLKVIEMEKYLI